MPVTTQYEVGDVVYAIKIESANVNWSVVHAAIASIRVPDDVPTIKYTISGTEYDEAMVFVDRAALVVYINANWPA